MSSPYAAQQSADEARNAARKARELADILTKYADSVTRPEAAEQAKELFAQATTKLDRMQENFRKSAALMSGGASSS